METDLKTGELAVLTKEDKEISPPLTDRALSNMDTLLREKGIGYYVIGSVARRAYMGIPTDDRLEIDVLIPQGDLHGKADEVFRLVESRNPGIEFDTSLSEFLQEDDGSKVTKLKRGNIEYTLDPSILFERRVETLNGTSFSTLPPETLLHTFIITGSHFRPKDWTNALQFGRWVRDNVTYDHSYQVPFHNFARDMWTKSPLRKVQYKWREFVKSMPPTAKKILLEDVYQRDPVIAARNMFNKLERALCGKTT